MNKPLDTSETLPDLESQLAEVRAASARSIDDATRSVMAQAQKELAALNLPAQAIGIGDEAPDFDLPDAYGMPVSLSKRLREGNVVLCFYRGGWCPYCNLELRALTQVLPQIHALNASLIAISPESPDYTLKTIEEKGITFPILRDRNNSVAGRYGLVFSVPEALRPIYQGFGIDLPARNGDDSFRLPVPATYVIDQTGRVRAAHVEIDYTRRMEPALFLQALEQIR